MGPIKDCYCSSVTILSRLCTFSSHGNKLNIIAYYCLPYPLSVYPFMLDSSKVKPLLDFKSTVLYERGPSNLILNIMQSYFIMFQINLVVAGDSV